MTYTPAPWTFQLDDGHIDIFIRTANHKEICIVRPPYFHPEDFRERVEHESNAEALANAQLIAAAPELHEVAGDVLDYFADIPNLEEIVEDMSEDNFLGELIRKALTARRKAIGKS
jgi:hypothetical protein